MIIKVTCIFLLLTTKRNWFWFNFIRLVFHWWLYFKFYISQLILISFWFFASKIFLFQIPLQGRLMAVGKHCLSWHHNLDNYTSVFGLLSKKMSYKKLSIVCFTGHSKKCWLKMYKMTKFFLNVHHISSDFHVSKKHSKHSFSTYKNIQCLFECKVCFEIYPHQFALNWICIFRRKI